MLGAQIFICATVSTSLQDKNPLNVSNFARFSPVVTFMAAVARNQTTCKFSLIFSLAYAPYSLSTASRMIAHTVLSDAYFLHLLTPADLRSPSIQSNHLIFVFLLPPPYGFPTHTFFTILSSDILSRWPAQSNLLTFIELSITVPQFPHWQIYGLLIFEPKSCVTF